MTRVKETTTERKTPNLPIPRNRLQLRNMVYVSTLKITRWYSWAGDGSVDSTRKIDEKLH